MFSSRTDSSTTRSSLNLHPTKTAAGVAERLRLRVARLVDGSSEAVVNDAALLIVDGMIAEVGPNAAVPSPEGTRVMAFTNATALPGLIDTHVHLTLSAEDDPIARLTAESDDELVVRGCLNAERLVRSGVTTAVDRGARNDTIFAIRDALAGRPGRGPRLLVSGRPITRSGGHTHHMHGEADGVDGVRRAINVLSDQGVDAIKIIATGGMLTPGSDPSKSAYPTIVLRAAADEAHRRGLKITAHAHGVEGMWRCVHAGIDSIEHATMLDTSTRWAFDPDLARTMSERGVTAVPGVADSLDNSDRLRAAGVQLIAGTDVGVDGTSWDSEMLRELKALVAIGLTPLAAIRAATIEAAIHIGRSDIGALEPGRAADVLIVDGQADQDITALARPRLVIAGGRVVQPTVPAKTLPAMSLVGAGFERAKPRSAT
jgi:imidazolonepropionase-like amidohydrolase